MREIVVASTRELRQALAALDNLANDFVPSAVDEIRRPRAIAPQMAADRSKVMAAKLRNHIARKGQSFPSTAPETRHPPRDSSLHGFRRSIVTSDATGMAIGPADVR